MAEKKSKLPEPKTDATYGQRSAFPGLDHPGHASDDDDLDFEDETDALAYLQSVRHQASDIPRLLVAPKAGPQLPPHLEGAGSHDDERQDRSIYGNGIGDSRGYYHDGAYTAAPDSEYSDTDMKIESQWDAEGGNDAAAAAQKAALQESYFSTLISQFQALRDLLHADPPHELIAALDREHGTFVGNFGPRSKTFAVWNHRIRYTDPHPVQIAAMDRRNALKVLRIVLGGKFIRRGHELRERTSRWIWALLARLPDRGEMDYTEVGWVRELGKRAVLMMVSIAQMDALRDRVDDDLEGGEPGSEGEEEGILDEVVVDDQDELPAEQPTQNGASEPGNGTTTTATATGDNGEDDDGEIDMDLDDGEVSDASSPARDIQADIAAAKARLLQQLSGPEQDNNPVAEPAAGLVEEEEDTALEKARAEANTRATLNMILTVAGELYGQRDLLEFRDPFPAM
ncbi:hypothetical protein QBC39DRAFT_336132 [Podospora conica]|nr:hypothetical protein QBC39DRAFT_336132 [Schizothecium conicum]